MRKTTIRIAVFLLAKTPGKTLFVYNFRIKIGSFKIASIKGRKM
jgi:hypothetical protein